MKRTFFVIATFVLSTGAVHAHMGHAGELAGHAHWVGLAAVLGAAAVAALAVKISKQKKDEEEEQSEPAEVDGEGEGAPS
ncbi:DUF6732 family protein [Hoeflea sp.]|uniref:DUF6732 family protein n=1 Tax=Hoeflea sp. TaxID=1940281 RepID=UPI003B028D7A